MISSLEKDRVVAHRFVNGDLTSRKVDGGLVAGFTVVHRVEARVAAGRGSKPRRQWR